MSTTPTTPSPDDIRTAVDKFFDSVPFLAKNKTYIAAAGLLIYAGVQFYTGDVGGAIQTALGALGLFGIRHAITKSAVPAQ